MAEVGLKFGSEGVRYDGPHTSSCHLDGKTIRSIGRQPLKVVTELKEYILMSLYWDLDV